MEPLHIHGMVMFSLRAIDYNKNIDTKHGKLSFEPFFMDVQEIPQTIQAIGIALGCFADREGNNFPLDLEEWSWNWPGSMLPGDQFPQYQNGPCTLSKERRNQKSFPAIWLRPQPWWAQKDIPNKLVVFFIGGGFNEMFHIVSTIWMVDP